MPEEFEEQQTQQFDWRRYLDVVRRHYLLFLTLLLFGWAAVWGSSWFLQSRYKSSTLILVDGLRTSTNYVEPNVSDSLQNQLQSITEQMLSRTRLIQIIEKLHLYNNKNKNNNDEKLSLDEKVVQMRKDIKIKIVHNTQGAISAFRVSYTANDPHTAQQVTSELTDLFISENLNARQKQSESTTQFLRNQLAIARSKLADQEARVQAFQTSHQGSLPTEQASNLQILSGLQSQLQNEQNSLSTARQQRAYHQSMIDQYRALQGASLNVNGNPTGLAAINQQLDTLRAKLTNLRTRYTDRYPAVMEVKAEIARTEKSRNELISRLKKDPDAKNHSNSNEIQNVAEAGQNASLLQFESQLKSDEIEIANREGAIANLRSRINDYQGRLAEEPAVAQQLANLTRGYVQSQANYNSLLKKENDSQMATSMEQDQEGQHFTIIDPPSLPLQPDFPNRLKMSGIGIGAGLGLGILVVGLLEFVDDRLHTDAEIMKLLSMPVISEIPEILSAAEQARNRRKVFLRWAMTVMVVVIILAATAFSYRSA